MFSKTLVRISLLFVLVVGVFLAVGTVSVHAKVENCPANTINPDILGTCSMTYDPATRVLTAKSSVTSGATAKGLFFTLSGAYSKTYTVSWGGTPSVSATLPAGTCGNITCTLQYWYNNGSVCVIWASGSIGSADGYPVETSCSDVCYRDTSVACGYYWDDDPDPNNPPDSFLSHPKRFCKRDDWLTLCGADRLSCIWGRAISTNQSLPSWGDTINISCSTPTPTPTPTPTKTPTPTPTNTPIPTNTPTPTPTSTSLPTNTPTPTPTFTPTSTPTPTPTPACPDDSYEPNNSFSAATFINAGSLNGKICSGDDDYFRFTVSAGNAIGINLTGLSADLDIALYNGSQVLVAASSLGGASPESISYMAPSAGTYYLSIYGWSGAGSSYTMTFNLVAATPTPTPTFTPTATPTSTPTFTPTNTPTSTPTSTPTNTPTPTPTPTLIPVIPTPGPGASINCSPCFGYNTGTSCSCIKVNSQGLFSSSSGTSCP